MSNSPNNSTDDDEFGGAVNSVAKIFRNRKPQINVDEDDEFGGAVNSVEKIFRKRASVAVVDDEFGGATNSVEKIDKFIAFHHLDSKFKDYLNYLSLRDEVSELRIKGLTHPHPYFQSHPSCQNRRYMDRESQYFIHARNNYNNSFPITDAVFHLIFRKYSTYEAVKNHFNKFPGDLIKEGRTVELVSFLSTLETPFTGAYLIPHRDKNCETKIEGWVKLFTEFDFESLNQIDTAEECFQTLKQLNGLGDFLAMQFTTELSWLNETKFGCNEFVVPGNGAVRGLNKIGISPKNHTSFLHALTNLQPITHPEWLPMTLMDYQNTFCEFDKFTRYLGGYENQGRVKMKRLRKPNSSPITSFETTEKLLSTNKYCDLKINTSSKKQTNVKSLIVELGYSPIQAEYDIFAPPLENNKWLVDRTKLSCVVEDTEKSITIPLVIDTEFTDERKKKYKQQPRAALTTQIAGIAATSPRKIYAHTPQVNVGRELMGMEPFAMVGSDFQPIDYLRDCGLEVNTRQAYLDELKGLPKCFVVLYGHFLTAEINLICSDSIKQRIKELQRSSGDEQITSGRRIYSETTVDGIKLDWVSLKHIITINGIDFELCIKLVDTGAIHGIASYQAFCDAVNWKLTAKDNFTKDEKGRMLDMAIERPVEFEEYAIGDLDVFEALEAYDRQWRLVYDTLGLLDYYETPKLTIGGTVKQLYEGSLASHLGIHPTDDKGNSVWRKELTEIIDKFVKPASASHLRQFSTRTRALLAKVEGGRCRNNRPTEVFALRKIKGKFDASLICDIDISGCYGEGMRNQSYFIGVPMIFDYEATVTNNDYVSLRQWLISLDVNTEELIRAIRDGDTVAWENPDNWGELMSGAWQARISTKERLKYAQDFFASWFTTTKDNLDILAKTIRKMKADSELQDMDWVDFDEENGTLKIFNHEIWNGVLTHDGLQWIFTTSPRQRNELLDKIQILSAAIYPRSQKIDETDAPKALEILKSRHKNWKGRNTTEIVKDNFGNIGTDNKNRHCHAWFSINLGELLIDDLLIERKKAQIQHGKKSSLDVLFKLCVNTLYGDMVSKFFMISNTITGNNVTARARAMAWYMEKGLHGILTITDGCPLYLNNVLHGKNKRISGESINLHRSGSELHQRNLKAAPLGGVEYLMKDGEVFIKQPDSEEFVSIGKGADNSFINTKAIEHLQEQFKLVDVLHAKTTAIKVTENLEVKYIPRTGQFSFETKNVHYEGAFHGSANHILVNSEGQEIKNRAYETNKPHEAVDGDTAEEDKITLFDNDRYGKVNNPGKDFLNQILTNPEAIRRQTPAIKKGILKLKDYKNLSEKYDRLGIEPGDSILRTVLLQEFSLSQFTFKTYEQYMTWYSAVSKLKKTDKQSIESYFLNDDGTLNFQLMCEKVDEMIANDVINPFDELDRNRHRQRAEKRAKNPVVGKEKPKNISLSHPSLATYHKLQETLKVAGMPDDFD